LVNATKEALDEAINSIKIGLQLGIVGNSIYNIGKKYKLSIIDDYGGHGICNNEDGSPRAHALPFISNKSDSNVGIRFTEGLSLAIEPLFSLGTNKTKVDINGFDVICDDLCAHFEHTLFIHSDHIEIMTKENDNLIYF
jgi:methionyl aminopeptidase